MKKIIKSLIVLVLVSTVFSSCFRRNYHGEHGWHNRSHMQHYDRMEHKWRS